MTAGLWDLLTSPVGVEAGRRLHCWDGDGYAAAPWPQVVREAERMTLGLRRAGVGPGDRVATVLTNGPEVVRGVLATWLAGGVIASLPVPARGMDADEYADQLQLICEQLEPAVLLLDDAFLGFVPERLRQRFRARSWGSVAGSGSVEAAPRGPDELAFIQYSSGSTSTPKGCMLTPRAIAAQLHQLRALTDGQPGKDVGLSWLPLSHDMGLFGCLLYCWSFGYDFYLSTPERFTFAPRTWFGDAAAVGATLTAGTNTALFLGARAAAATGLREQLRVRACIIGAERIDWATLRFAVDSLAPSGFSSEALLAAYGLAEATLAVAGTPVHEAPRCVSVDSVALADGEVHEVEDSDPAATRVVSTGRPCPGVELLGMRDDALAELRVRSPSLAVGYYADPAQSAERFEDGVLRSRDLAFVREGELYPVGRTDDLVVVAGRNVYACEVENAVGALDGARRGCCTLIDRGGDAGARMTLLMELHEDCRDRERLAAEAAELAMVKAGVALDDCIFLERGTLPKTPTGKIQRHRCRALLESGRLRPLAAVGAGA